MSAPDTRRLRREEEVDAVLRRRRNEALDAGLTFQQAEEFARSELDVGQLRRLVAIGCPPELIARIVL